MSPCPLLSMWSWENLMLWSGFSLCKEGITIPCYLTTVLCEFADTHKAPWKWRGLHKSLALFTQQMFSPENKVINGTIVQLVERVQKFPFTTSRSSCGWLYGLSVLMPSCIQNSQHNGLSWKERHFPCIIVSCPGVFLGLIMVERRSFPVYYVSQWHSVQTVPTHSHSNGLYLKRIGS